MTATELFKSALHYLEKNYFKYTFFTERDLVWTMQNHINKLISEKELHLIGVSEYVLTKGQRVDLVIVKKTSDLLYRWEPVEVAIEFKYEPDKERRGIDIPKGKFPVTEWSAIEKDFKKMNELCSKNISKCGYTLLIDEGGRYYEKRDKYDLPLFNKWREIGKNCYFLLSRYPSS